MEPIKGPLYIVDWVNFYKTLESKKKDKITERQETARIVHTLVDRIHSYHQDAIICIVRYRNHNTVDNVLPKDSKIFVQNININGVGRDLGGQGWDDFIILECNNILSHLCTKESRVYSFDLFRNMIAARTKDAKTPTRKGNKDIPNTVERPIPDMFNAIEWDGKTLMLEGETLNVSKTFMRQITADHTKYTKKIKKKIKKNSKPVNVDELRKQIVKVATGCIRQATSAAGESKTTADKPKAAGESKTTADKPKAKDKAKAARKAFQKAEKAKRKNAEKAKRKKAAKAKAAKAAKVTKAAKAWTNKLKNLRLRF